jgi:hypothetical protein
MIRKADIRVKFSPYYPASSAVFKNHFIP